ncbi:membrane protein [Klebsiella pneumoniae]|uniref:Membrane protein n=1 Tax=Klebsiella pneumoniae TaxID=573 RepID=A0A378AZ88_KLEPN|nr:membrane protein [Klebsiella pneumoniae]
MINPHQPRDIPQILLSVLFLALIIISCLWVVQPFILSFAWAGTVVIATWPVLLRLQRVLFRQTTAGGAGDDPVAVFAIRYSYCSAGQQPGG